jgi:hypothetical protein
MLNTRIEIDTIGSPYKINRKRSAMLDPYFKGKNDWFIFCERIDQLLQTFEEIKATWMVLGVISTLLLFTLVVGIILTFVLVDEQTLLGILAGCLFGACFLIFASYLCLMDTCVVKPLNEFSRRVDEYCAEIASKNDDKIEFHFDRSRKCKLFWDSDFKVWIDVTSTDPVDLTS